MYRPTSTLEQRFTDSRSPDADPKDEPEADSPHAQHKVIADIVSGMVLIAPLGDPSGLVPVSEEQDEPVN